MQMKSVVAAIKSDEEEEEEEVDVVDGVGVERGESGVCDSG